MFLLSPWSSLVSIVYSWLNWKYIVLCVLISVKFEKVRPKKKSWFQKRHLRYWCVLCSFYGKINVLVAKSEKKLKIPQNSFVTCDSYYCNLWGYISVYDSELHHFGYRSCFIAVKVKRQVKILINCTVWKNRYKFIVIIFYPSFNNLNILLNKNFYQKNV